MEETLLKSSVISIVPFAIDEEKPGIYPGHFEIPPAKDNIPQILVIGESIHYVETADPDRSIPVVNPSYKVAASIVNDYINSQLGIPPNKTAICGPGIFWKVGVYDLSRIHKECADELKKQEQRQFNWFTELVRIADDDWEKTHQHRAISDMQRFAAKWLKLNRPWIVSLESTKFTNIDCPGCGNSLRPDIVVCPTCKVILNPTKYKTLQFATS